MITAIIETRDDEARLAYALAALVPAATEGIVSDVVVLDRGSKDGTAIVADAAGCTFVAAGDRIDAVAGASLEARGEWLLLLSPATTMAAGWEREALAFIDQVVTDGTARSRVAVFRAGHLLTGLRATLARLVATGDLKRRKSPPRGEAWLMAKECYRVRFSARASASPASAASSASGARRGAA